MNRFFVAGIAPLGFRNPRDDATTIANAGRHREPSNEGDLARREEQEQCNFHVYIKIEINRRR